MIAPIVDDGNHNHSTSPQTRREASISELLFQMNINDASQFYLLAHRLLIDQMIILSLEEPSKHTGDHHKCIQHTQHTL